MRKVLRRSILVLLFVLLLTQLWPERGPGRSLKAAPAKGGMPLDVNTITSLALNEDVAAALALSDAQVQALLEGKAYDFVHAVRLGEGEARAWTDLGCGNRDCAHVTLYNYTDGGTIEAIVHLEQKEVLSQWIDSETRPGPSEHVLPKALEIAAQDPVVEETLGDIRMAESAMVPMPIWLADSLCREDWCVDLTYHDPAGSGRVFHVVVNMEAAEVARTFYSRARPDQVFKRPAQTQPFEDGCHAQYGWEVCWEMTAHDGLLFRDAAYEGESIFSTVKIGQAEVWYPAWPGGYRDEMGFRASVPPHFGTEVIDLENGFEVRQLFTEFLRWPNCICCYRYEQVLRFLADGAFEFRFISHGPGCEDLSNYRPFWRIDIDLGDPGGDELWYWNSTRWSEVETESEYSLFEHLGPEGQALATLDGDLSFRWIPVPTDPLALDEARLFALQAREGEGDGPIVTGPADTYRPPRQWMNDEAVSGENIVLWYVPILKTKKGEPWWCMPDPGPEFSPCESILRVEPAGPLVQPTEEELATIVPTPPPTPSETQVTPAAPAVTPTPRSIPGDDAETIMAAAGCTACHRVGDLGEANKVGPDLTYIGLTANSRVPGMSAETYIYQSIVEPNVYLAPQCPNGPCSANVMPRDYGLSLSAAQLDTLVGYLLDFGYDYAQRPVQVVGTGIDEAEEAEGASAAATVEPVQTTEPLSEFLGQPNARPIMAIAVMMALGILLLLGVIVFAKRRL